jgi:1,2-diacylglycerol 3-alpha-glucosyltransferase
MYNCAACEAVGNVGWRYMRIAHFTDTSTAGGYGVTTSIQTLTDGLVALGCECVTVSPGSTMLPRSDRQDQWLFPSLSTHLGDLRLAVMRFDRQIKRVAAWSPDVVHVHTPGPVGLLGVLSARSLGVPVIHTYHTDLQGYADAYKVPTACLYIIVRWLARKLGETPLSPPADRTHRAELISRGNALLLDTADAVVLPTSAVLSRGHLDVNEGALHILPTPACGPPRQAIDARQKFRDRYAISSTSTVALFVGRIHDEKNIGLLVAAISQLAEMEFSAKLLLVGPVYGRRKLARMIRNSGVRDRIIVTGAMSREAVWSAYVASDVFVLPSLTDTQGLVVDEALASGLPVVMVDADLYSARGPADRTYLVTPEPRSLAHGINGALGDAWPAPHDYSTQASTDFAAAAMEIYQSTMASSS